LTNELVVNHNVKIMTSCGHCVKIIGGETFRHFDVQGGTHLTLQNLVLVDGHVEDDGGSIFVAVLNNHFLELKDVVIKDNSASSGGGIFTFGSAILKRSKVVDNTATTKAGGIYVGGHLTLYQ